MLRSTFQAIVLTTLVAAGGGTVAAVGPDTPGPAPPAPLLTLDDAVRIALEGNDRLGAADAGVDAAEAAVRGAGSGRLPQVALKETFSRTTNPTLVFSNLLGQESFGPENFQIDSLNEPSALDNFNTAVSVSYALYSGGRVADGLEAARLGRDAVAAGRERTRQEVVREVMNAYSGAVLAEAQLAVSREALETARANVKLVADLREGGLVVESDLLQARVRESEVEEMVIRATSAVDVARAALNLQLGRDLDTPYSLPDDVQAEDEPEEPLEDLVAEAQERRPDLAAAEARLGAGERAVGVSRSGFKPTVGIEGRYEANAEDFIGSDGSNWSVFAGVRLALFGNRTRARVAEAEARAREARRMRDLLGRVVDLDTRRSWHDVRAARQSLEQSRRAVALAGESLRIVRDRYREGLTTLVELLDAETALTRARTREVASRRDLLLSQAGLKLAVGRL